jgi:hypothetical protein
MLVRVIARLMVAQAVAGAAVGLPFSRRHLPSVFITLSLVIAVCLVAMFARTGTRAAWLTSFGFESVYFLFGFTRFVAARYVGGTLFSLIIGIMLLHPAVTRAYAAFPSRAASRGGGELGLSDAPGEAFGERAVG